MLIRQLSNKLSGSVSKALITVSATVDKVYKVYYWRIVFNLDKGSQQKWTCN